jgi:hypothetical protein
MSSTKHVEPLDPAQFTYTAEENERLWRVRELDYLPFDQYLAWCSYLTKDEPPSRETTPADAEPFTL